MKTPLWLAEGTIPTHVSQYLIWLNASYQEFEKCYRWHWRKAAPSLFPDSQITTTKQLNEPLTSINATQITCQVSHCHNISLAYLSQAENVWKSKISPSASLLKHSYYISRSSTFLLLSVAFAGYSQLPNTLNFSWSSPLCIVSSSYKLFEAIAQFLLCEEWE